MASSEIKDGTGKLKGRFCVRLAVPKSQISSGVKMLGCFKSRAAAEKRLAEAKR
jgi:hypothetical protein